eukprot:COSAG06_NODE_2588_length_6613_cov_2.940292_5_plen_560_part_00
MVVLQLPRATRMLDGHAAALWDCAVSADGDTVVSSSRDRTALWDLVAQRKTIGQVQSAAATAVSCALAADGKTVVVGDSAQSVRVWQAGRNYRLRGHVGAVQCVAISGDGRFILSVGRWRADPEPEAFEPEPEAEQSATVLGGVWTSSLTVAPEPRRGPTQVEREQKNHTREDAADDDGSGEDDEDDEEQVKQKKKKTKNLRSRYGASAKVASTSASRAREQHCMIHYGTSLSPTSRKLEVKRLKTRKAPRWLNAPPPPQSVTTAATVTTALKLWDLQSTDAAGLCEPVVLFEGPAVGLTSCAISDDGRVIAAGAEDASLLVWDSQAGNGRGGNSKEEDQTTPKLLAGHSGAIRSCAMTGDGSKIVTASDDKSLILWEPANQTRLTLTGHTEFVSCCDISADGSRVVSASFDQSLRLWHLASAAADSGSSDVRVVSQVLQPGHGDLLRSCAISSSGSTIVSAAADDTAIWVWDLSPNDADFRRGQKNTEAAMALRAREMQTPSSASAGASEGAAEDEDEEEALTNDAQQDLGEDTTAAGAADDDDDGVAWDGSKDHHET